VRNGRVRAGLLGVEHTTVERVEFDEDEQLLVAHVRPIRWRRRRCGICQRRCRGYDQGEGRRRCGRWIWARCRAYDTGTNLNELRGYFLPLPVFPAPTVFFPCLVQRGVHR